MSEISWGFRYDGAIEPSEDFNCVTCLAARQGKCPTHAQTFMPGCAHCDAVQGKPCQKHWGLKAAIEGQKTSGAIENEESVEDFSKEMERVLADPLDPKFKSIIIDARAHRTDRHRERFVEITVR